MKDRILFQDNYVLRKMPRVYLDMLRGIIHELKTPLARVVESERCEVNEYRYLINYKAQTFIKSGFITIDLEYIYFGNKITLNEFLDFIPEWHIPESVTISDKDELGVFCDADIKYNRLTNNKVFEFSGVLEQDDKSLQYKITLEN